MSPSTIVVIPLERQVAVSAVPKVVEVVCLANIEALKPASPQERSVPHPQSAWAAVTRPVCEQRAVKSMDNLLVLVLDTKESFLRALVPARVNLAPGRCVRDGPELMVFDTHNGVCSIGDMLPQIVNQPFGAIFD